MFTKLLIVTFLLLQPIFPFPREADFVSPEDQILQIPPIKEEIFAPEKISDSLGIKLTAKSAIILDRESEMVLFEKNSYKRLPIASLTKMMTAIVALESSGSLDEIVTISASVAEIEPKKIKLQAGEQITIRDLLHATLQVSANDAALALAEHVGSGEDKFVEKMNKKALDLELFNTHFANPTGLDEEENYSTARDLVRLFDYALQNEIIKDILVIKEYTAASTNTQNTHFFKNTNNLLDSFLNIEGGKTGFTDEAGWCLMEVAENDQGNQIIAVILGSEGSGTRFQETKALIDWAFRNYKWE